MEEHADLPKWKLKANWLLKQLIHIWYGEAPPSPLFDGRNFVRTFLHIMEQYLQDCGSPAPQAELDICLIKRRITFAAIHGSKPQFTSQAHEAEWIAEAVATHRLSFELITDDTIKMIIRLSHAIEDIIKTCGAIPSDYLQSIDELLDRPVPDIHELPTIPIAE
jgi:hypothetical protein